MEVFRVGSQPSAVVPGLLRSSGWMLTLASCSVTDPSKPSLLRNAPLTVQPLPCTTRIRIKLANCSPVRPIAKTLLCTFLCLCYTWKTWGFCFKNSWWAQWTYFSWCIHKSSFLLFHILNVHYDWWRRFRRFWTVSGRIFIHSSRSVEWNFAWKTIASKRFSKMLWFDYMSFKNYFIVVHCN